MESSKTYDFAVAWNWEYDREFIAMIQESFRLNNLSVLEIHAGNVEEIFAMIKKGMLQFRHFLDRASDEDESFQPLARYLLHKYRNSDAPVMRPINPLDLLSHAADKATMHMEFLAKNIDVPYTIIISPFNHKQEVEFTITELAKLGRPFIIKPANTTGGGIGVVMGAETLKEIIDARQFHKNDKYLLQETIKPIAFTGRRAWFRVFYAFGDIIPCWWDDVTHIYSPLSEEDERQLHLERLRNIAGEIHSVCQLDFFSTELVCTADRRFVTVDYVNEMCDMRLQSQIKDGVPDAIVQRIVSRMMEYAKVLS
ncbi:MAG: hypothetical protein EHM64_06095 [Ignavibacteriae bacterium]|nr:MAG: hypothetical protein EHM64_06095 [Ignavibacteriota bacterium]